MITAPTQGQVKDEKNVLFITEILEQDHNKMIFRNFISDLHVVSILSPLVEGRFDLVPRVSLLPDP